MSTDDPIANAIYETLISPNEIDRNLEAANVVDGLFAIARALHHVARALEGFVPDYSQDQLDRYDITRPSRFAAEREP